jgi:hypothetical protein
MLNAGEQTVPFVLPWPPRPSERWETLIDTFDPWVPARRLREGDRYELRLEIDGGAQA